MKVSSMKQAVLSGTPRQQSRASVLPNDVQATPNGGWLVCRMTTSLPLPDDLSGLQFSLAGQRLSLYPKEDGTFCINVGPPTSSWGLVVDLEEQRGRERHSQGIREFRDGRVYLHFRGMADLQGSPGSFEDWLRERVTELIHAQVRGHIESTLTSLKEETPSAHEAVVKRLCQELADLPPLPQIQHAGCQPICDAYAALLQAHHRGSMLEEEAEVIRAFLDAFHEPPMHKHLRDQTLQQAFILLPPDVPRPVREVLDAQVRVMMGGLADADVLSPSQLGGCGPFIQRQPVFLRRYFHALLLPRCATDASCLTLALAFAQTPAEAVAYASKGLTLSPTHPVLRWVAVQLADQLDPASVRTDCDVETFVAMVRSWPVTTAHPLAKVLDWNRRYEALMPHVAYRQDTAEESAPELLRLEEEINRFWLSILPPPEDPLHEGTAEVLCAQTCFKAKASEAYLGWMRAGGRFQEAIEHFLRFRDDPTLTALRLRSDWYGEGYMGQGLSCLLDSQRDDHIELGMSLMDDLSSWTWKQKDVPYALACIASRGGDFPRALHHAAEAVEAGSKVKQMLRDPDFANLLNEPAAAEALRALDERKDTAH